MEMDDMSEEQSEKASNRGAGEKADRRRSQQDKTTPAKAARSKTPKPARNQTAALHADASIPEPAATGSPAEATTLTLNGGGAGEVEAISVAIRQGGIGTASAEDITVSMGGIGMARADDIAVSMGGVGLARADRVSSEMGVISMAVGRDVYVTKSGAAAILADEAHFRDSGVGSVVASSVKFEGRSAAFIVVARNVEGDVKPVLDWRGAAVACATIGIFAGIALLARRRRD
jgi:hypothetical protein